MEFPSCLTGGPHWHPHSLSPRNPSPWASKTGPPAGTSYPPRLASESPLSSLYLVTRVPTVSPRSLVTI